MNKNINNKIKNEGPFYAVSITLMKHDAVCNLRDQAHKNTY